MTSSTAGPPNVVVRWFHATDAPKYDHSPFKLPAPQPPIDLTAPVIAIQTAAGIITSTNPVVSKAKAPTSWTAFSVRDSAKIEDVYQGLLSAAATGQQQPSPLVLVNEDYLHEVDVAKCEIYPVYWYGPTYHVQRGTWFVSPDNGAKFIPCDDNLAKQLEEGYKKFKPWLQQSTPTLPVSSEKGASLTSTTGSIPALQPDNKGVPAAYKPDQKWALFGPYMNSYVIYNEKRSALIISDQLSSKLARAVMSQISRNTDTQAWGTRVWRGWDEVEKLLKKNASTAKKRVSTGSMDPPSLPLGGEVSSSAPDISTISAVLGVAPTSASNSISDIQNDASPGVPTKISRESLLGDDWKDDENAVQDRHIDHLVLVVHGVGQKMGERLENVDFAKDCTTMRQAIKECSKLYFSSSSSSPSNAKSNSRKPVLPNMADHGGVQVLPVQWRHKLEFGKRKENKNETDTTQKELEAEVAKLQEREVHVDDITLEGVASIRYLVSDIVLDVLLYMTPRYRQEMVNHVVDEMNRIYRAYMQRNPNFKGKVSIYGHSLGSVLAFDILCNQPFGKTTGVRTPASLNLPQRLQSEMDLSDVIGSLNSDLSSRRLNGLMERSEIEYKCLEFEVDKFFAVGSPVALFLLLKGDKLQGRGHPEAKQIDAGIARPACNAVYNVFHPHDPVAYRFEPLACKMMAKEKPVPIQYNKGGLKGTITGISDFGSGIVSRGYNMFSGLFVSPSIIAGNTQASGSALEGDKEEKDSKSKPTVISDVESLKLLNPRGRMDFAIQEGVLENPYLSSLSSQRDLSMKNVYDFYDQENAEDGLRYTAKFITPSGSEEKDEILVDFYYYVLLFAKDNHFSPEKASALFSIMKKTHGHCTESPFIRMEEDFSFFKALLLKHCIDRPPFSTQIFSYAEMHAIAQFATNTYFRHYLLYKYAFTKEVKMDFRISNAFTTPTQSMGELAIDDNVANAGTANTTGVGFETVTDISLPSDLSELTAESHHLAPDEPNQVATGAGGTGVDRSIIHTEVTESGTIPLNSSEPEKVTELTPQDIATAELKNFVISTLAPKLEELKTALIQKLSIQEEQLAQKISEEEKPSPTQGTTVEKKKDQKAPKAKK